MPVTFHNQAFQQQERNTEKIGGAIRGIMQQMADYEQRRQDMELRQQMLKMASEPMTDAERQDPQLRWQKLMQTVANYQPTYARGLQGALQRFGSAQAGPSTYRSQLTDQMIAMQSPQAQAGAQRAQAGLEAEQSRQAYWQSRGGNDLADLKALNEQMYEFDEGDPELDVLRKERSRIIDRIRTRQEEKPPGQVTTSNLATGEQFVNGRPTGRVAPGFPGRGAKGVPGEAGRKVRMQAPDGGQYEVDESEVQEAQRHGWRIVSGR